MHSCSIRAGSLLQYGDSYCDADGLSGPPCCGSIGWTSWGDWPSPEAGPQACIQEVRKVAALPIWTAMVASRRCAPMCPQLGRGGGQQEECRLRLRA
mmetsp:Transcript_49627/g.143950  ORF Transcript_49627/g.143950 Transcript_49627/m.143950 type:complete len:97 (+) Transcript_49627:80-370(+)